MIKNVNSRLLKLNLKKIRFNSNIKKYNNKDYKCIDPWSTPIFENQIKSKKINLTEWTKLRIKREEDPNYKSREINFKDFKLL